MTDSVIDADTFTVRRSIRIAAAPEKVWAAITEPVLISKWFGDAAFDGSAAGSLGTLTWPDWGAVPVRIEAVDAPRSITYRWSNDDRDGIPAGIAPFARSTAFTFTLSPDGEGTHLVVVETGFETTTDPAGNLESHREGWDSELDELIDLLEGGA